MKRKDISTSVIRRLPKYHRYLKDLINSDVRRISSRELSKKIGFTASQIRQDLNNFGGFGQQGYGYNVEDLYTEIGKILGLNKQYNCAIIGAGNLGQAIANYTSFDRMGFKVTAIFDVNPSIIGTRVGNLVVHSFDEITEIIEQQNIQIVYICTGKDEAQFVASKIEETNALAILNFAPTDLKVKKDLIVENTNLTENILMISYLLKSRRDNG